MTGVQTCALPICLPNIGIKPEIIPAAIMALSIFESAMVAEIVRSGINSIDYGQTEGAFKGDIATSTEI